jgi:acyl phosphate:glycerol-3-phosphate acyltransferase
MILALILVTAAGYFSGSLPFGFWAGKRKGIDIREHGSGNIGATNVWRVMGRNWGLSVFLLDVLKGLLPVLGAAWFIASQGGTPSDISLGKVLAGFAAILGHTFTIWLGGKGGKGVATSAGVLLGVAPWGFLVALATWMLVFFPTRIVSLASIGAGLALPVFLIITMAISGVWDIPLLTFGVVVGLLVVLRHRSNIRRILDGTEARAVKKKVPTEGIPS